MTHGAGPTPLRPRYGRLTAFGAAVVLTLVTLLGGAGLLGTSGSPSYAASGSTDGDTASLSSASTGGSTTTTTGRPQDDPAPSGTATGRADQGDPVVPADSGTGKRVVFSLSQQRVWLVTRGERVERTYLVSGSLTDNLAPGVYAVYSRSMDAIGVDDSGTMRYMVRFAYGKSAAIGFHDIPVKDGERVQTRAQLGTPRSHGCIRQWRPDARALWDFAPEGTEVDVVA